jgi:hypothetical protein
MRSMCLRSVIALGLLWASSAFAESYNESGQRWIINPTNPTWTCPAGTLLPGETCFPSAPKMYSYVYGLPLYVEKLVNGVLTPKLYLYTQEWGSSSGPGSGCPKDSFMVFELPWSYAGLRGDAGVTYRGVVHPCDNGEHVINTVFKDPSLNSTIFAIDARGPDGNTHKELWLGQSPRVGGADNGLTFSWSLFISTTKPDLQIVGLNMLPDPSRPGVWWGLLTFNSPTAPYYLPASWIEVNWNTNQIRVKTSATGWTSLPIGGVLNTPPYPDFPQSGRLVSTRGRYEVWTDRGAPRSGNSPCMGGIPTPIYQGNVNPASPDFGNSARASGGNRIGYSVVTPSYTSGPWNDLTSSVRPVPSDYVFDFDGSGRIDFGCCTNALYTGTQNATICTHDLIDWNPWSGSGITFTNVTLVP